ncbi:hypothetical protein DFH94DRAFT_803224 [Russula ochroleuca]|jgi:hypothetical protein|uniref:Uncharacterized protein n=1 Tax=Russula ochroleuca TaxID=152965 RepID=A0A9P5MSM0_9AGAM|nr:hypothetical protein DFH94DRAFT_803224 [Russula ochroleuca]
MARAGMMWYQNRHSSRWPGLASACSAVQFPLHSLSCDDSYGACWTLDRVIWVFSQQAAKPASETTWTGDHGHDCRSLPCPKDTSTPWILHGCGSLLSHASKFEACSSAFGRGGAGVAPTEVATHSNLKHGEDMIQQRCCAVQSPRKKQGECGGTARQHSCLSQQEWPPPVHLTEGGYRPDWAARGTGKRLRSNWLPRGAMADE